MARDTPAPRLMLGVSRRTPDGATSMTFHRTGSPIRTHAQAIFVFAALTLLAAHTLVVFAQTPSERWVGTWATSSGQSATNACTAGPGIAAIHGESVSSAPAPAAATAQPGQTFAPLPFIHFSNQTLRQIIHASIGGSK